MREGMRRTHSITLEDLFEKYLGPKKGKGRDKDVELRLKVVIQGEKSLPASFLQSSYVPHGLLWNSKHYDRQYEVESMHIVTFSQSENYFWKYRLWKLIQDIVDSDPKKTRLEKRTPDWVVKEYIERFAYHESNRHRRLIYDSDDSDVLDDVGTTRIPRHFRKVHKSEIYGLLAAQAEWFATDGMVKWKGLIPFKSWFRFWKEVKRQRREANRNGVLWGWPIGYEPTEADLESPVESDADDSDNPESDLEVLTKNHPVIGKDRKALHTKLRNQYNKEPERRRKPNRRGESESVSSEAEAGPQNGNDYDSTFSVESTPSASSSSHEDIPPTDPAILRAIPFELWEAPKLPGPDFLWWCPVPRCEYYIDMRNLTQDNVRRLKGDVVVYLTSKKWTSVHRDKTVYIAFQHMAGHHYEDHITAQGIKWVKEGNQSVLRWINPRDHPSGRLYMSSTEVQEYARQQEDLHSETVN
ncbi:hypothetical protein BJ138DRAFT_33790 [Hygrophoropsis aurantiaca]|uniref:Uncharacterized protein n=1 Tax=Hygrophoropsis aurantiaca TaxID=72124 RepID=A0ACB7ZSP1_9AGAM|nr:hypothetical protein BJ138DRAFT_33790 [Hygrophoropsis aurantiaca]